MKKKFKVLVPVAGFVEVELLAEDEEDAMEKAFESEIDISEPKELRTFVKVNHTLKLCAVEIKTEY